jgi:thymidine phosphorylase
MDQVLGRTAGNALEVREAIDVLRDGTGEPRLVGVTLALASAALELVGVDGEPEAALHSGAAAERFAHMVTALGGPHDLLDAPERHLAEAPVRREVTGDGVVEAIDVRALGLVVMELGGGRRRETDDIDPAVGLTDVAGLGEDAGRLATIHARDEPSAARAEDAVRAAVRTGPGPVEPPPLAERIGSADG